MLTPSDFDASGLAGSCLTSGTAVRKTDTVGEVPIAGTLTVGPPLPYTITLTVPTDIAKVNAVSAQSDVPITLVGALTITVNKASQTAPNVTANENHETDEYSTRGIDTDMEFSADDGQTWIPLLQEEKG